MKGHIVVWQFKWKSPVAENSISFTIICALDYWQGLHSRHNICNFVIFHQPATFINCLVFAPEPFFAYKLESKYYVSLGVDAKHIANYYAALYLVKWHIQYVACP